ncbi:MAG: hypothetical protein KF708_00855 [Pirellulales bacterium]|nr:hypothetical protein [Pirellulales bacterium]
MGLLQVLVSTAHFLTIDVAIAAPFVCLWLEWRATKHGDALADAVGRRLARDAALALVVGSLLGAASLALLWWSLGSEYGASLARVPTRRYWFAAGEWLFSLACLTAYAVLWDRLASRRWLHRAMAFVGGTNLAYHFPVLFAIVSTVTADARGSAAPIEFRQMIVVPQVLAHVAHDVLASFVVTGAYLILLSGPLARRAARSEDSSRIATWGGRLALPAALAQFPVGIWLWTTLPAASSGALLLGDLGATIAFGVAVVGAIGLLHHLATVALGDSSRRQALAAAAATVIVVLAMVTARYRARLPLLARPAPAAMAWNQYSEMLDTPATRGYPSW